MPTDRGVAEYWPHLAALEASLARLSEGATVPIVMRADVHSAQAQITFMQHLRSQMYLTGL